MKISKTSENKIKAISRALLITETAVLKHALNNYLAYRFTRSEEEVYRKELTRLKNGQRKGDL